MVEMRYRHFHRTIANLSLFSDDCTPFWYQNIQHFTT